MDHGKGRIGLGLSSTSILGRQDSYSPRTTPFLGSHEAPPRMVSRALPPSPSHDPRSLGQATAPRRVSRRLFDCDADRPPRSEEHTSELQSLAYLVCRLLLEKKKKIIYSLE